MSGVLGADPRSWRLLKQLMMLVWVVLLVSCTTTTTSTTTATTIEPQASAPGTQATTTSTSTTTTSTSATTSTTVPMPSVSVQNLGLTAVWLAQLDDGVAVGVRETDQRTDLNDDGDTDDVVVHVIGGGQVSNTGLQAEWGVEALDGGGFFVNLHEKEVGVDLNDDGDTNDNVPQVWSADTGVTNVRLAAWAASAAGGALWLEPWSDSSMGLRLWQPNGEIVGTELAGFPSHTRDDGAALITVFEEYQDQDLDGDGRLEAVLVLWVEGEELEVIGPSYQSGFTSDGGVWRTWNEDSALTGGWHLGFWHADGDRVDFPLATVNHTATPDGGLMFRVSEYPDYWSYSDECVRAAVDLNGDGDCGDFVLHRWTPQTGLVDLALSGTEWCPECEWGYVASGDFAYASQPEWLMEEDLNRDGEINDATVLQLVEGASVRNLGVDVTWNTGSWAVLDGGVVVLAPETGGDLNADGDTEDRVFRFVSQSGAVVDLGLQGTLAQEGAPGQAILLAEESGNGRDLNNDGLISDNVYVIHLWRPGSDVVNTGITNGQWEDEMEGWRPQRVGVLPDGRLVALVPEHEHGMSDLNGDGDLGDVVVHLIVAP